MVRPPTHNWEQHIIEYILVTGANWSGPIKNFRLVVDKGSSDNLVSFCGQGVRKISPTQFEIRAADFTPTSNLSILILSPTQPPPASGGNYLAAHSPNVPEVLPPLTHAQQVCEDPARTVEDCARAEASASGNDLVKPATQPPPRTSPRSYTPAQLAAIPPSSQPTVALPPFHEGPVGPPPPAPPDHAEPMKHVDDIASDEKCSGWLQRIEGELQLRAPGPRAEGECVIAKADEAMVLQTCQIGKPCTVYGKVSLCEDAGECVEIKGRPRLRGDFADD